jgi:hypothetical protein
MPVTPEMIREVFSRFGRIVDMRAGVYAAAAHPTHYQFIMSHLSFTWCGQVTKAQLLLLRGCELI